MAKYNQMYVGSIIERMIGSEEAMDEFHENYLNARHGTQRKTKEPTAFEIKVAKDYLSIGPKRAAQTNGITAVEVQSIIAFVSRWQFRTGNRI